MKEKANQETVDSVREVCDSIQVGRQIARNEQWNFQVTSCIKEERDCMKGHARNNG